MTEVDTPDNQRGVVNAQILLATVAGGTAAKTVTLPANIETLVVLAKRTATHSVPAAIGATTGFHYPAIQASVGELPAEYTSTYVEASSVVDPEVTIEWGSAPTETWYIYADAFGHVALDPATASAVGKAAFGLPNHVLLVGGDAGGDLYPIEVNRDGTLYAIPAVPSTAEGDHPAHELLRVTIEQASGAVVVAAPGAGKRIRVFSFTLSSAVATQVCALREGTSSNFLGVVCGVGNTAITLPGQGFPLASNTALETVFAGAAGTVYGAVYYTVETV